MFFRWLKEQAKNAVLGGVSEAIEELAPTADAAPPDLARLRGLAASEAKQLAAAPEEPTDEAPKPRGRSR